MELNIDYVREKFPALEQQVRGEPAAFFDGPGGTQVPRRVIEAMENYFKNSNANKGGHFKTSRLSDEKIKKSREALSDFLGCRPEEVALGENMTTLNYRLAFALGKKLEEGDEIIISELDHEANRQPWLDLQKQGIKVREIKVNPDTCTLDHQDFASKLCNKTEIVAITHASNAVGTIPPVRKMVKAAQKVGALTIIDAVHYALHGPIDVKKLDCDFLLCSTYKFFGPHLGVMYGKKSSFQQIEPYRLRPQSADIPYRIERGTTNHEGIAGAKAAVEFIADLGDKFAAENKNRKEAEEAKTDETGSKESQRRQNVVAAMELIDEYESPLAEKIAEEISQLESTRVYRPPTTFPSTSTVSFVDQNLSSREIAAELGDRGIFVWNGDFYATTLVERLGEADSGGLVRIGLAPYNTDAEVDRLLASIKDIIN